MNPNRNDRNSNFSVVNYAAEIERINALLWAQLYALDAVV